MADQLREKIADAVLAHWRHMPVKGVTADWIYGAADAILALFREEGVLVEWKPFEQAPDDGRELIVYRPDAGVFTAAYIEGTDEDSIDFWCSVGGEDLTRDLPTHFAPLPKGPAHE